MSILNNNNNAFNNNNNNQTVAQEATNMNTATNPNAFVDQMRQAFVDAAKVGNKKSEHVEATGKSFKDDCDIRTYDVPTAIGVIPVVTYHDKVSGILVRLDINNLGQKAEITEESRDEALNRLEEAVMAGEAFVPQPTETRVMQINRKNHKSGLAIPAMSAVSELAEKNWFVLERGFHCIKFHPDYDSNGTVAAVHTNYDGQHPIKRPVTANIWRPAQWQSAAFVLKYWDKEEAKAEMSKVHDAIDLLIDGNGYSIFFGWFKNHDYTNNLRSYANKIVEWMQILETEGVDAAKAFHYSNKKKSNLRRNVHREAVAAERSGVGAASIEGAIVARLNNQQFNLAELTDAILVDVYIGSAYQTSITIDPTSSMSLTKAQKWIARKAEFKFA